MKTGRLKTEGGVFVRSKFSMKSFLVFSFLVIFVLLSIPLPAYASEPVDIPNQLKPWKQWVLYNMAERLCPTNYNQENVYQCVWPSRLDLFVKPARGRFEQHLLVLARSWVSLPGGAATWPTAVKLADQEVPVMNRNGIPSIEVPEGEHVVSGFFSWQEMPEVIQIPARVFLVAGNARSNPDSRQ